MVWKPWVHRHINNNNNNNQKAKILSLWRTWGNQLIALFWKLVNKGKESNIYLTFLMWTILLGNQEVDEGNFLFFKKYKFIYFNWRLITLQYCIGFAIHQHVSATGIHVFPILNLPPSSVPVPFLWVPSIQYHALNLDWWLVSYTILYMFQCHSPKSSHPLPLPQSTKDCSI